MFKGCKCRIFSKADNKMFLVSAMYWEDNQLKAVQMFDSAIPHLGLYHLIEDEDVLMNFIGQYDKNGNELWEGDIVKFDPKGHSNFILGMISYDIRVTRFIIDQLTDNKDFMQTQEELDEEQQYTEKRMPSVSCSDFYKFDNPTNWYDVKFYDEMGDLYCYSELEKIGNIYENPELIIKE